MLNKFKKQQSYAWSSKKCSLYSNNNSNNNININNNNDNVTPELSFSTKVGGLRASFIAQSEQRKWRIEAQAQWLEQTHS